MGQMGTASSGRLVDSTRRTKLGHNPQRSFSCWSVSGPVGDLENLICRLILAREMDLRCRWVWLSGFVGLLHCDWTSIVTTGRQLRLANSDSPLADCPLLSANGHSTSRPPMAQSSEGDAPLFYDTHARLGSSSTGRLVFNSILIIR